MADADRDATLWAGITSVLPMAIILTPFARTRLFPSEPRGNTIQDCTPGQFEQRLNEESPLEVLDGYAPFCKLHVHRNWTSTRCLTVPVSDDNRHLLRPAYEARTRDELPVLVRWFRSEEHTSELQSLMRSSYAVFCLITKTNQAKIQELSKSTIAT